MRCICNIHYKFKYDASTLKSTINPYLENYRYHVYKNFEDEFIQYFAEIIKKKHHFDNNNKLVEKIRKAFARWIMLQIALGCTNVDPIIPSDLNKNSFDQLKEDIVNFIPNDIMKMNNVDKLIDELDMNSLCKKYNDAVEKFITDNDVKSFDHVDNVIVTFDDKINEYTMVLKDNQKTFDYKKHKLIKISKDIYNRIKILFISNRSFNDNLVNENHFHYLLYCLMMRYIVISDQGIRQGAKTQKFFGALEKKFHINFETFAASFAASSNYICSLFYDIEKYFGSYGNFFKLKPIRGFYQVNPPLDSLITTMACERVLELLNETKQNIKLGFILFIPTWDFETVKAKGYVGKLEKYNDFPIYYKLKNSKYMLLNYDIIGKKINYIQYQSVLQGDGSYNTTTDMGATLYDFPHVMVLGTQRFGRSFNKNKMIKLLDSFDMSKKKM